MIEKYSTWIELSRRRTDFSGQAWRCLRRVTQLKPVRAVPVQAGSQACKQQAACKGGNWHSRQLHCSCTDLMMTLLPWGELDAAFAAPTARTTTIRDCRSEPEAQAVTVAAAHLQAGRRAAGPGPPPRVSVPASPSLGRSPGVWSAVVTRTRCDSRK